MERKYTVTAIIDGNNYIVKTDNIEFAFDTYHEYVNDDNCTCADLTDNTYAEVIEWYNK